MARLRGTRVAAIGGAVVVEAAGELEAARSAFGRRAWTDARDGFIRARARDTLTADDHQALAESAWWIGDIDASLEAFAEAYRMYRREARRRSAAMSAMYLAVHHTERGDGAIGSGWMSRAHRLLRDEAECAEHGYPLYFEISSAMVRGCNDEAITHARRMQDLGRRFGDPNLLAVGTLGEGRALVKQGRAGEGLPLLDEAMLTALSDDLHPLWTGAVYCNLMDACHEMFDLRRAAEWTRAASRWCDSLSEAVMYRGICRVHRAQVLRLQGAWEPAERAAAHAAAALAHVHVGVVAEAHYEAGEVQRLLGRPADAEESFRRAHEHGRDPQPGLALLRLDQGRPDAAAASIRAALLAENRDRLARARLHVAQVEIALATGDLNTARTACTELRAVAAAYDSSGLRAEAEQAHGAVLLAGGEAEEALAVLRTARRSWQELDAPYGVARTRLLLAEAYQALGDDDAADLERDAARDALDRLGAGRPAAAERAPLPAGLTGREAEVLRHVAAGHSNRQVATALCLSEKTVARHLSNIFTKLGLSSRTAAAAYAFERGLATPPRG
ncbi:helix-turn-helix transcriptional regulator [Actinomadura sp. DC4]|uniref:helix-turn-helix transcriptional regulator n=1 Tax=Actinomadura sp. DC4 TaxID=3055069 RepID=UPI0025B11793|nr:helix-turn-helix transcriptional regulator [Actinomadura sp. DC4]MDN3356335.1 response regulator transcription factor [Actinomadura sp. DC4]